jgi:phosphatidate cytidylyltransferase
MSFLFILVISIHFILGGAGIYLINKKLPPERSRSNLIKYLFYLLIFSLVIASVLVNKYLFTGLSIIILSCSLFEIMKIGKQPCKSGSGNAILFFSVVLFTILAVAFLIFTLLPSSVIIYTYAIVIIFDGASQISGQIAGRNKLFPALSPAKTWEGLAGGTLSAVITSVILHGMVDLSIFKSMAYGLLICLASFSGDIGASAFKRAFSAKDFGRILPGQGGMLDRFDSFIPAGALAAIINLPSFLVLSSNYSDTIAYIGCSVVLVFVLLAGEAIQYLLRIRAEYSRIFSHVIAGMVSLLFINIFSSGWYVISLCIQSALFLYVSEKMGIFGSHHNVERRTYGSSFFFAGILIAFIISELSADRSVYFMAIAILSISDPLASVTGMNIDSPQWPSFPAGSGRAKTYIGSAAFFATTFIIITAGLCFFHSFTNSNAILLSAAISVLITLAEAFSPLGSDNISIPLVASLSLSAIL